MVTYRFDELYVTVEGENIESVKVWYEEFIKNADIYPKVLGQNVLDEDTDEIVIIRETVNACNYFISKGCSVTLSINSESRRAYIYFKILVKLLKVTRRLDKQVKIKR